MKFAYFMNTYPMTSSTFIRREIEEHERAGYDVLRFAIRPWDQTLVDPKDIREKDITYYLLKQGVPKLALASLRELATNPIGFARGVASAFRMMKVARGKRLKHIAYFLEAVLLKQKTIQRGVDHLHTHFSTNSATVALLCNVLGGPTFSMTVHGPDELYEMTENSMTEKVRRASFVAVISRYCQGVVDAETGHSNSDKLNIVRCGLDLNDFVDPEDVPDNKTLVCVGRFCEAKAQSLLVEAMAEVVQAHPDARLILIGDGETRPQLEASVANLGLDDNVGFAGWKSNVEVSQALRRARAMVLPSLAEGLPVVIMESFALGRPVVSTEICGIPELVDASCGWLAQPGDKRTLVQSLDAVLSKGSEELTEMGKIGRSRVVALHDQKQNSEQLRTLFFASSDTTR